MATGAIVATGASVGAGCAANNTGGACGTFAESNGTEVNDFASVPINGGELESDEDDDKTSGEARPLSCIPVCISVCRPVVLPSLSVCQREADSVDVEAADNGLSNTSSVSEVSFDLAGC